MKLEPYENGVRGVTPIRGYFGIGIFHGKTPQNLGTLWRSAHNFGADFIFTIGKRYERQASDTTKAWRHVPLYHYVDLDDFLRHLPYGCQLVGIELAPSARPLTTFVHPERVAYLLGAEDCGLNGEALARCESIVMIPGAARCLNVSTAGAIVLYDRWSKI